ncbi:lipoprotein signal peptidase [Aureibaculum conchae]|uniref:lipoprotein signal peptidase n=1 Tax=Aureibaculum sp. 2308TA14-22 TaxID=3108392 RepID=UPI00339A0390
MKRAIIIIIIILLIDQWSKVYIKTNFVIGEGFNVMGLDWFRIHFIENYGMAWGTEFGGKNGKLFLTFFRLIAIVGIGYWLYSAVKTNGHKILIVAIAFIFAGALGNIIDSVFYGVLFGDSHGTVATFLPEEGGYSTLFHGKVVDLFYFPIIENAQLPSWIPEISFNWPDWIPGIGGKNFSLFVDRNFTFFQYIFNVADFAISTGVGLLLVFNKRVFPKKEKEEESKDHIVPPVVVRHYEKPKS